MHLLLEAVAILPLYFPFFGELMNTFLCVWTLNNFTHILILSLHSPGLFPGGSVCKESAFNVGDLGLIPGLGRSPGKGKGYPLQYSGLENSMKCTVHGVTKSRIRLSDFHFALFCPDFMMKQQAQECCGFCPSSVVIRGPVWGTFALDLDSAALSTPSCLPGLREA